MSRQENNLYEFGPFRLDAQEHVLLRDGGVVPLAPKAIDLLVALVENSGHVISRDELIKQVWPDSFVEEANLSHHIFSLRKALGEDGSGSKYIETIPRRGYRFVADVSAVGAESDDLVVAEHSRSRIVIEQSEIQESTTGEIETQQADLSQALEKGHRPQAGIKKDAVLLTLACCVTAISIAIFFWATADSRTTKTGSGVKSLAVLPFKMIGAEADDEYLGIGLTDALILRFSRLKQIVVRPTNAVARYGALGQDPTLAGRELKVDSVLDGTIQRMGDRIRVTVQLVSVDSGKHLWADKFEEKFTDLFAVQDRASDKVAAALELRLTGAEQKRMAKRYTDSSEAYRLYLKGGYYWNKWTPEGWQKAIEYFNQAIELDPNFAPAYGWLGAAYQVQGNNGVLPPKEANAKAKWLAERALELDDDVDQGHYTLAAVKLFYEWDWPGVDRELKRAIELNPNYVEGRMLYVYYLMITGHTNESLAEAKTCEDLNPVSPFVSMNLADMLLMSRTYDAAIAQYRKTLDLDPHYFGSHFGLGGTYLEKGMNEEATIEVNKGLESGGIDKTTSLVLGYIYARTGKRTEAQALLNRLKGKLLEESYDDPMQVAYIYVALGEKDPAFEWLEKAYAERNSSMIWLNVEPRLDNLRDDPRFASLQRRVGLLR